MSAPTVTVRPGAWLCADDWNEAQVRALEALRDHGHASGSLGGDSVDPAARMRLAQVEVDELRLRRRALDEAMGERVGEAPTGRALAERLPVAGGAVSGDLEVRGDLHVRGDLRVGGELSLGGQTLAGERSTDVFLLFSLPAEGYTPEHGAEMISSQPGVPLSWIPASGRFPPFDLPWPATALLLYRVQIYTGGYTAWPVQLDVELRRRRPEDGAWVAVMTLRPPLDQSRRVAIEGQELIHLEAGTYSLHCRSTYTAAFPRVLVLAFRELR